MPVRPVPRGYRTVTPYLAVRGAARLLAFVKAAFGAKVKELVKGPKGGVTHAAVMIGDSMVMMGEARKGAALYPAMLYVYVKGVDAVWRKAVKAGGKIRLKPTDMFYGDRTGAVDDACGNQWWIATHRENLTEKEIARRAAGGG